MNLLLTRKIKTQKAVIGELLVDGRFECYTLEDPDGAGDRIPTGTYNVITDFSNRFQKIMPHIIGSPAIDDRGIRIHCGNTEADTEGCILLGQKEGINGIEDSRAAFDAFYRKLEDSLLSGEKVTLVVSDETQSPPIGSLPKPQSDPRPDSGQSPMIALIGMILGFLKLR